MAAIPGIGQRAGTVDAVPRRPPLQRALGRDWQIAWLFLLPLVLVLVGLVAYPFVSGIILSFQHKVVGRGADLGRAAQLPRAARRRAVFRHLLELGPRLHHLHRRRRGREARPRHVHGAPPQRAVPRPDADAGRPLPALGGADHHRRPHLALDLRRQPGRADQLHPHRVLRGSRRSSSSSPTPTSPSGRSSPSPSGRARPSTR